MGEYVAWLTLVQFLHPYDAMSAVCYKLSLNVALYERTFNCVRRAQSALVTSFILSPIGIDVCPDTTLCPDCAKVL